MIKVALPSLQRSGDNAYAGWIHAVALNGSTTYRLGYRDVVSVGMRFISEIIM